MHGITSPINWSAESTYQCIDCGYQIPFVEAIEGSPADFLVARKDGMVDRVVTLAGNEVHRCPSPFLMSTW